MSTALSKGECFFLPAIVTVAGLHLAVELKKYK
jgi:hypothetical protein